MDILERSERQAADNFAKITNTLSMLTTSIAEGFSLFRQIVQPPAQPSYCMPYEARGHKHLYSQFTQIKPFIHSQTTYLLSEEQNRTQRAPSTYKMHPIPAILQRALGSQGSPTPKPFLVMINECYSPS